MIASQLHGMPSNECRFAHFSCSFLSSQRTALMLYTSFRCFSWTYVLPPFPVVCLLFYRAFAELSPRSGSCLPPRCCSLVPCVVALCVRCALEHTHAPLSRARSHSALTLTLRSSVAERTRTAAHSHDDERTQRHSSSFLHPHTLPARARRWSRQWQRRTVACHSGAMVPPRCHTRRILPCHEHSQSR